MKAIYLAGFSGVVRSWGVRGLQQQPSDSTKPEHRALGLQPNARVLWIPEATATAMIFKLFYGQPLTHRDQRSSPV